MILKKKESVELTKLLSGKKYIDNMTNRQTGTKIKINLHYVTQKIKTTFNVKTTTKKIFQQKYSAFYKIFCYILGLHALRSGDENVNTKIHKEFDVFMHIAISLV